MMRLALSLALLALGAGSAEAQLITFGDFEKGVDPGSDYITLFGGDSTSITGWTVTGRDVDYISGHWLASVGTRSLDLSGSTMGGVEQVLSTRAGVSYTILFDMAGNPGGGADIKRLEVTAANAAQIYSFDTTGRTERNMGWVTQRFDFTALDSSTTLSFISLTNSYYGPALAHVRGSEDSAPSIHASSIPFAVPEPATLLSCGIAGLLGLGLEFRRRGKANLAS